jgi:hypothetical protein|tara:strand:+ start:4754 stop:5200 length:447 start_codon:yes stop_codon:yes gene_type:complete
MVKRHHKGHDGKYHISGHSFARLIGSRAEVMHGTVYKTAGGLTKSHLKYNKHGKIVSKAKSAKGPQILKRLTSKGYFTRKGHFGVVKRTPTGKGHVAHKTHKKRKTHRRKVHHKKHNKTHKKHHKKHHKKRGLFMHERRGKHGRFHKL